MLRTKNKVQLLQRRSICSCGITVLEKTARSTIFLSPVAAQRTLGLFCRSWISWFFLAQAAAQVKQFTFFTKSRTFVTQQYYITNSGSSLNRKVRKTRRLCFRELLRKKLRRTDTSYPKGLKYKVLQRYLPNSIVFTVAEIDHLCKRSSHRQCTAELLPSCSC